MVKNLPAGAGDAGDTDSKSRLTGKDPDAETDRRQEEKGVTKDEIDGWHH